MVLFGGYKEGQVLHRASGRFGAAGSRFLSAVIRLYNHPLCFRVELTLILLWTNCCRLPEAGAGFSINKLSPLIKLRVQVSKLSKEPVFSSYNVLISSENVWINIVRTTLYSMYESSLIFVVDG